MFPVFGMFYAGCKMYAHVGGYGICICPCGVTKHRDQSPSPMGVNWVSDGVSINFIEYIYYKSVRFYSSLKRMIIIDS